MARKAITLTITPTKIVTFCEARVVLVRAIAIYPKRNADKEFNNRWANILLLYHYLFFGAKYTAAWPAI